MPGLGEQRRRHGEAEQSRGLEIDGQVVTWSPAPDIPTVSEFVPGYDASQWYGVGVPKNTRAEVVNKLNKEINAALADPKLKARIAEMGETALPTSPANFGKLIADETEKWAKVIRTANIKPD
jgi:tripartite-type tricarboxylate transporter receptor subunit TctC